MPKNSADCGDVCLQSLAASSMIATPHLWTFDIYGDVDTHLPIFPSFSISILQQVTGIVAINLPMLYPYPFKCP